MKNSAILAAMVLFLSGCAVNQGILLKYTPEAHEKIISNHTVTLDVIDARPYVKDQSKPASYIGHFRGGYGNTFNAYTAGKVALAQQFSESILSELKALGFETRDTAGDRKIKVEILDYNFDAYINGNFWYEIKVTVLDGNNMSLSESVFKESHVIKGSVMMGPMSAFKKEMPVIQQQLIKKMIRDNKKLIDALI